MKLYEINFRHYSQKDSQEGILGYLLAESDEQVYEYLKSEPTLKNEESIYVSWMYKDDPDDEEYEEDFKERIINCCGDMYDDESEVYDLYYGATQYGWNCINEDISVNDASSLIKLGIEINIIE